MSIEFDPNIHSDVNNDVKKREEISNKNDKTILDSLLSLKSVGDKILVIDGLIKSETITVFDQSDDSSDEEKD
jgi:hypothetical protein